MDYNKKRQNKLYLKDKINRIMSRLVQIRKVTISQEQFLLISLILFLNSTAYCQDINASVKFGKVSNELYC